MRPTIRAILASAPGTPVSAFGWVRTRREGKTAAFLEVSDGSCPQTLQVVLPPDASGLHEAMTGAAVGVEGTLHTSPTTGQHVELHAERIDLVGPVDTSSYPLQKKRHSLEQLREWIHLRPRSHAFGAVWRLRDGLCRAIHDYLGSREFRWVHTPLITGSDCEGGGQQFRVTTLLPTSRDPGADFFGREAHLTVSGQLELEAHAMALGRVYAFGPCFRAENSHTARHLAEFWMLEPEMAFADLEDDLDLAFGLLRHLARTTIERHTEDLSRLAPVTSTNTLPRIEAVATATSIERIPYGEAVDRLRASGEAFRFEPVWGADLQAEHENWLLGHVGGPVAVTDWPFDLKAFYMKRSPDGRTVRCMDILLPGAGEVIGGSQREEDPSRLLEAMHLKGLPAHSLDWYVDLRRHGSCPHAGFGMGLERLLLWLTGLANVRDVIPHPRTAGRLGL